MRKDATAGCFGVTAPDKSVADDTTKVSRSGQRDIQMPTSYSIIVELNEHFHAAVSENLNTWKHDLFVSYSNISSYLCSLPKLCLLV